MLGRVEGSVGTRVPVSPPSEFTGDVLTDVVLERHRQIRLWGHNEDTPDGTGPGVRWARAMGTAELVEKSIREMYDDKVRNGGALTWVDFLLEEVAEAFKEDDPEKLYSELVQVAAVAVSWCEKLRQR
jgi:hypothetical protein